METLNKGIIYYTDNNIDENILDTVRRQLKKCCKGMEIISVTLKPVDFGKNIVLQLQRGYLTMFRQILAGLEASTFDVVFLVEHDILYHPSHFDFTPPKKDVFYYDYNRWTVHLESGKAAYHEGATVSGICAYRDLLLKHYRTRVDRVEKEGFTRRLGFEPGNHPYPRGVDDIKFEVYYSEQPYIDIRHGKNLTWFRWKPEEYRRKPVNWKRADEVPGWGRTRGRFQEILNAV